MASVDDKPTSTDEAASSPPTESTGPDSSPNTVPENGKVYKIKDRESDRVITLTEGKLRVEASNSPSKYGSSHWVCVEEDTWLKFYSPVSKQFIGHDERGTFGAENTHNKGCESFHLIPSSSGGYILATLFGDKWLKMVIHEQKKEGTAALMVAQKGNEGTVWVFVSA